MSNRPSLSELFGASSGETGSNNLSSGFTSDTGLSPLQSSRVAIAKEATLDISDLSLGTSSSTPERILVRLDSSERGSEDELGVAQGRLLLNGTELQNGVVHSLTVAEYNSLQYVARDIEALDYLSVIGVDDTNQTRGEAVTTAITTSASGVERFLRDGLERFEFIAKTEAGIPVPRVFPSISKAFVNGDILSDINAGLIEVSVNQFSNLINEGTDTLLQSSGNTLDVTIESSPLDGVVVNIKALDDSVVGYNGIG